MLIPWGCFFFAGAKNASSVLAPIAVTGNTGLIPQGVGGEYYTLSAVAAEVQVKATVVTKDHLKAITAPREFSSPATGSQADNLFDIQDANPPFVVTPALASTLTAANTGQSTKATTTAALATYSGTNLEGNSTTVQELAFQFAHGNYKEQIAAFRFRVTVTTGHTSQQFMVNVHTFSTPELYLSKYLDTAFLSSPSHKTATIKDSNGTVEISGVAQNEGKGFKSTQRQIFQENDANSFYQKAAGDNEDFCQINSRLGGNVDDYLPVLESETLVVSAVNGQVVSLSHKSTYDMLTIDSTPMLCNNSNSNIREGRS